MTEKKPTQAEKKPSPKQKLTDAERHKRFVVMAHEVEAEESSASFDKAFKAVVIQSSKSKQGA